MVKSLIIIDTETGGLDPLKYSLLSYAGVVWRDGAIKEQIEVFVKEPEIVTEEGAMKINKIDLNMINEKGFNPLLAVQMFEQFINIAIPEGQIQLAGHNVGFDVNYMKRLYRLADMPFNPRISHRVIDTSSTIHFLSLAGRIPPEVKNSSDAFKYLGVEISEEKRHTALGDAIATAQVLNKLLEMVKIC